MELLAQIVSPSAQPFFHCLLGGTSEHEQQNVLLITDIGADIDDTLALLALLGSSINLVGIVTTGNHQEVRASVCRNWLARFNVPDVPVLAGEGDGEGHCFIPDGFVQMGDPRATTQVSAAAFILQCAQHYRSKLTVVAIGALSPLAEAIKLDRSSNYLRFLGGLFFQGSVEVNPITGQMAPSALAFNVREDEAAAQVVFSALQDHIPFSILGKFAAYRVGEESSSYNCSRYAAYRVGEESSSYNCSRYAVYVQPPGAVISN
jgi:inosine-uridine nucleoside N-ribohydrolase